MDAWPASRTATKWASWKRRQTWPVPPYKSPFQSAPTNEAQLVRDLGVTAGIVFGLATRSPAGVARGADSFVDLTTAQRRTHILDGDATGGGHGAGRGISGKSEFPRGWSDNKVIDAISDIATDPNASRSIGRGGRTVVEGVRGGINIRVIVGKDGEIVTGFPTNVPRNP